MLKKKRGVTDTMMGLCKKMKCGGKVKKYKKGGDVKKGKKSYGKK